MIVDVAAKVNRCKVAAIGADEAKVFLRIKCGDSEGPSLSIGQDAVLHLFGHAVFGDDHSIA